MKKHLIYVFVALLPLNVWADVVINESNFPDENFRNYLLSQYYGADGVLSDGELRTGFMNVDSMSIASLKGIEFFTHLKRLDCSDNQLTELDLSANQELSSLNCSNNQLTSLNLQNCQALGWLECNNNQLASLDLSGCPSINYISCYSNKIKAGGMDEFMEKLPASGGGLWLVDTSDDQEENEATVAQVKIAKDKSWHVQYYLIDSETGERTYAMYRGVVYETDEGLAITKERFPDENFRNYLLDQDYGADGVITAQELRSVTKISVLDRKIVSMQGIEYFYGLKELRCGGKQLTTLDISQNTGLEYFYLSGASLTSVDLSNNWALDRLVVGNTKINSLDLSSNVYLTYLQCTNDSNLTKIDLSQNVYLSSIYCNWNNQLEQILLPDNNVLSKIECRANKLTSLDISKLEALEYLQCDFNQLTDLDVSSNTKLKELCCQSNQLTELDVTNNKQLKTLYCFSNKIKGESMGKLVMSMPTVNGNGTFHVFDAVDENEGNECSVEQMSMVRAKNWTAYYCAWKDDESQYWHWAKYGGGSMTEGVPINEENFPEERFRYFITNNYDHNKDGILSDAERLGVTELYVWKEWVDGEYVTYTDINGVEYFPNLEKLSCKDNPLTSLDVSSLSALKELDCGSNQLTALNISGCEALETLYCDHNQLSSLDVSSCPNINHFVCSDNLLSLLDVSNCPNLVSLFCYNNQLTALDVSACQNINDIYCYSNNINGPAMDTLIESLPDWKVRYSHGSLVVIDETDPNEQNVCTTVHVTSAKAKSWEVRSLHGAYEGSIPVGISDIQIAEQCQYYDLSGRKTSGHSKQKVVIEQRGNSKKSKVLVRK